MSMANDMINGECCSNCGVYFTQEHGYPVICDSCFIEQELWWEQNPNDPQAIRTEKHIYPEITKEVTK